MGSMQHGSTRQQLHDEMTARPIIPRISQQINPYVRCEHSRAELAAREGTQRNRCAILGRQWNSISAWRFDTRGSNAQ